MQCYHGLYTIIICISGFHDDIDNGTISVCIKGVCAAIKLCVLFNLLRRLSVKPIHKVPDV